MQARGADDLLAEFEAEDAVGGEPWEVDYNVAPTKPVPVVLTRHRSGDRGGPRVRQLRIARWGLVPHWSAESSTGGKMINARAETASTLPAFRSALARRRCVVPADGWYEWAARPDVAGRQPYFLTMAAGGGLAFAGLYEIWGEQRLLTCAIVTTAAVGALTEVHERMPLVLPREAWADWLDPDRDDPGRLLDPPSAELVVRIELRTVGPAVGNVANAGPGLIAPATPVPVAQTLF